ncbi:hypothetical protein [Actinokineospora sp. UTMC 2448]|uniref:hypothetical protein n=1 Tax=Actinokineospora sp. UTMC 2448 TaxID=2268449 RepID=UPI002164A120|nr:hypothetical protein [Actinokineospora sp. UTMC 2448]UVS80605.1 hypothetical protein Actkin_04356 [Actinokineospora sp. UTMC 2448]
MTVDGINRSLAWALTLRRTARGGLTMHGDGRVSDHGFPVPRYVQRSAQELAQLDLVRPGQEIGWQQRRLRLTTSGHDVLVDLIIQHPKLALDPPNVIGERIISCLRDLPGRP